MAQPSDCGRHMFVLFKVILRICYTMASAKASANKIELSVVVVGLDSVVVAPLEVCRTVVTAQCELAPSYLAVLLELNEFFDCIVLHSCNVLMVDDWNS